MRNNPFHKLFQSPKVKAVINTFEIKAFLSSSFETAKKTPELGFYLSSEIY